MNGEVVIIRAPQNDILDPQVGLFVRRSIL